jgi:transcriptional/translational regulatory protein YebC/TACO1
MLEGLARGGVTYNIQARTDNLLAVIKRVTHMLNRKGAVQDPWPEG